MADYNVRVMDNGDIKLFHHSWPDGYIQYVKKTERVRFIGITHNNLTLDEAYIQNEGIVTLFESLEELGY